MQHEVSAAEARLTYLLFPHRRGLEPDHVEDRGDLVQLVARTRTPPVTCPECGEPATRVHDRYWRRHQDLSWCGRPVQAVLQVRRPASWRRSRAGGHPTINLDGRYRTTS